MTLTLNVQNVFPPAPKPDHQSVHPHASLLSSQDSPTVSHRVLDVIGALCRVQTARPPARGSARTPQVQIGDSREAVAAEGVRFYQPVGPVDIDVQEIDGTEGEGGGDTTVHAPHQHRKRKTAELH